MSCLQRARASVRCKSTAAALASSSFAPPLSGVRILDLTTALAGPSCTMYLGDLGAEVIKLEIPKKGDDGRHWGPPFMNHKAELKKELFSKGVTKQSVYFVGVNRNKKSLTCNLKTARGLAIAKELIKSSDILIENQITGKLEKLGLGFEEARKLNPDIIYCSITGYGQTGPYRSNPGYDAIVGGEAGIVHSTGEPDRPPVRPGIPVTDIFTGYAAVKAVLAAFVSKLRTGKGGVHIDCAMFDVQVAAMSNLASAWLNAGVETVRVGTGHTNVAPYQVFTTADSYIMIGIGNDNQFKRLCKNMDRPEWADAAEYATNADRVKNKVKLIQELTGVLMTKTTEEWTGIFRGKGFPFGSINNMEQVFNHPQAKERQLVQEIEHPLVGNAKVVAPAIMYNGERMAIRLPPPGLGEDTVEILAGLGYDQQKIAELQANGDI